MAWYDEAVFYHIYPLGATGAPKENDYGEPVHRLKELYPWIAHMKRMHFSALYIGPLFESVGHGYETTDYKKLDSRLGTNDDLKDFVAACHENGIKVIFDGVFNHTGRDFFAFKDLLSNRENSAYRDWYCNVNFSGNNEYGDGFSYDNWGGYNLLVKLNQRNPAVRDYICDVIRFWVQSFDIDGIRLDAADVLDFDFMKALRKIADEVKPDFWLMGEVIHGDYSRWANENTLHSVTNYTLHKALYSGHNDKNYFEIAHTVKRTNDMVPSHIRLYNFVDNHDVERIYTKLNNKAHFVPVHILLYTLPGIPSVYYGSEWGIEGRKEKFSDDSLRPCIDISEHKDDPEKNPCAKLVSELGRIHEECPDLVHGDYRELCLMNEQYSFARGSAIIAVNNADHDAHISVGAADGNYRGLLFGTELVARDGRLEIGLKACSGDIFVPGDSADKASAHLDADDFVKENDVHDEREEEREPEEAAQADEVKPAEEETRVEEATQPEEVKQPVEEKHPDAPAGVPYHEMSVPQLQEIILGKMAKNGPVTDQMRKDVLDNIWHDSLVKWAESF